MTNAYSLSQAYPTCYVSENATTDIVYIEVSWAWMSVPIAAVLMTLIFLVATMDRVGTIEFQRESHWSQRLCIV